MKFYELWKWAKTQKILIVLRVNKKYSEEKDQYEIDGRWFRSGIFLIRFKDGKKVGREKIKKTILLPEISGKNVRDIWVCLPGQSFPERPCFQELEGAMEKFPKKTITKKLRRHFMWL